MEADVPYVFNIVNCEKQNSQFNFGTACLYYVCTQYFLYGTPLVVQLVEALRYKSKVVGSIPSGIIGIFY
jgi:hypothetical protein